MAKKIINRLKVVLAEQGRTNKWLAEKLNKNTATVSRWCTNEMQPSLESLVEIADTLNVDVRKLLVSTAKNTQTN
ncbi:helix-turn-helix transcriptional regulator [Tenacibaculum ovolyticum]|uniref:helix-turn-helix transcriptional regulator n=1 Tax=Tenacibaculum ovolyticum TaxID=104270 RepID=UPI003BAA20D9